MSYRDFLKSEYELNREKRELRNAWPYRSYDHEYHVEMRIQDIDSELRRREDQKKKEREAEREAEERAFQRDREARMRKERMREEEMLEDQEESEENYSELFPDSSKLMPDEEK